ncbi:hypothetical protein BJX61DRAFT_64940 [Aspergillus egyptiacus]|nr:hypothetical protein BJX61DRAFT_64940 [Aspergillus egyptiacus]
MAAWALPTAMTRDGQLQAGLHPIARPSISISFSSSFSSSLPQLPDSPYPQQKVSLYSLPYLIALREAEEIRRRLNPPPLPPPPRNSSSPTSSTKEFSAVSQPEFRLNIWSLPYISRSYGRSQIQASPSPWITFTNQTQVVSYFRTCPQPNLGNFQVFPEQVCGCLGSVLKALKVFAFPSRSFKPVNQLLWAFEQQFIVLVEVLIIPPHQDRSRPSSRLWLDIQNTPVFYKYLASLIANFGHSC